jgi:general secretion pathway protein H
MVELMVVLVILGLATAAVVLAIPDPGGSLQTEAARLAARAKAARDGAIVDARAAALAVGPGGYEVSRRIDGRWRTLAHYDWAPGTQAAVAGTFAGRARFAPDGTADPLRIELRRGDRTAAVAIANDGTIHVAR